GPGGGAGARAGPRRGLQIPGPVLSPGYRNRPDLTGQALGDDGWFTTSDLGEVDEAGHLSVHGRADEMINTGGHKVAPTEVAAILTSVPRAPAPPLVAETTTHWG